jgi:hypothetical protein
MARGRSVIVGGGLGTAGTLSVGGVLVVANVDPPTAEVASPGIAVATFARATHLIVGQSNQILGTGRYTTSTPAGVVMVGNSQELNSTGGTAGGALMIGSGVIVRAVSTVSFTTVVGQGSTCIVSAGNISQMVMVGSGITDTGGAASVLVGHSIVSTAQFSTFLGYGISNTGASSSESVMVGHQCVNKGQKNTLIGGLTQSTKTAGTQNTVVGYGAVSRDDGNTVIGAGADSGSFTSNIIIGAAAVGYKSNLCMIGGPLFSGFVSEMCVGSGDTSGTPPSLLFRLTNSIGTDIAGGSLTLQAGLGTSAGVPGAVKFSVGVQTATGATLQASRVGAQVQYSATAGDTYLLVYDVNGANLRRVSVGANDSGGVGFKVLRIVN